MSITTRPEDDLFGIIAEFNDPDDLIAGAKQVREGGYTQLDAYTPFPVHGLSDLLGFERNWVPYIVLAGAVLGGLGGYLLQYYTTVIDYAINIGGRPLHSWPAFMVITFETAILGAAIAGVLGMLGLSKLPMPYHPVFNTPRFELASRDRFFLCVLAKDAQFEPDKTQHFLENLKPNPQAVFVIEQGATKIYE